MLARLAATVVMLGMPVASAGEAREVRLRIRPTTDLSTPAPVLDRLEDGDVLRVFVDGGLSGASGAVHQCIRTADRFSACSNGFQVQFGHDGSAAFQYQIEDPGICGVTGSCALVVDDADGGVAYALMVFGASAPTPPDVALSPVGPYSQGETVQVAVASLVPGAAMSVAFCDPRCGMFSNAVAGADGTATASVIIGSRCDDCGIAVISGAREVLVDVKFSALPTPRYSPTRLVIGLSIAAALLLAAWWLIATVDWRPPSEAATPELDRVEL